MTLVFFALSFVFLILFHLWSVYDSTPLFYAHYRRVLRACCVVCCCSESCDQRRQKNSDILWTKKAAFLKILIILASLTAMCMAAYSSSNLEITLSSDAWKTIHAVKVNSVQFVVAFDKRRQTQIEKVLAFGDGVLGDLNEIADLLRDVSHVFQSEVNVTGMEANLECISDFLSSINEPDSLRYKLSNLTETLSVSLTNEIASFNDALDALQTDSLDVISAPISDLISAQSSFSTFLVELGTLDDAIDDLEVDHSSPSLAETSANNLETTRTGVRDMALFVSELNALKASVNILASPSVTTPITNVETGIASISVSFTSTKTEIEEVEAKMDEFQVDYSAVDHCISDFKSILSYLETDVIELPSEVSDNEDVLDSVTEPLSSFFEEGSDASNAMQSLTEFKDRSFLPNVDTFLDELDTAKSNIGEIADEATDFGLAIDSLITLLTGFATEMDTLQTLLSDYFGATTSGNYDAMRTHALTLKPLISGLETGVGDLTTNFADTFNSATEIASIETSLGNNLNAQKDDLTDVQESIDDLQSLNDITSDLDDAATTCEASENSTPACLGDASELLDDVKLVVNETLAEVIETVLSTTDDAREALADARNDSVEEIDDFENEKRNLSINHFLNTPEDIGFALLADDVNDKLYIVTLCFYCVTIVFCLALITFVMINCQFGIGLTLMFFILLLNFYFLIGIFSSTILVVENDFCANLEEIVLNENSDAELDGLLMYYFTDSGNLRQVLLDAFNLNLTDLEAESAASADSSRSIISDWGTKGNLNDSLTAVTNKVSEITNVISELEYLFSYAEINPLYQIIKSFFCCDISSFLYTIWRDLTMTGAVSILVVFLGFFALHKVDKMPRTDCCGCTCRRRYLDDILSDAEDVKLSPKQKIDHRIDDLRFEMSSSSTFNGQSLCYKKSVTRSIPSTDSFQSRQPLKIQMQKTGTIKFSTKNQTSTTSGTKTTSLAIGTKERNFRSKQFTAPKPAPKILSKLEQLKLLSKLESAGLLSKIEKSGLTLSKIEKAGLLTTAEKLGVLSAAGNRQTPSLLFGVAFALFLIGPVAVYLLPDDTNALIAAQVVVAAIGAFGGAAAFGGASLLSTLQK
eukprot:g4594.t1